VVVRAGFQAMFYIHGSLKPAFQVGLVEGRLGLVYLPYPFFVGVYAGDFTPVFGPSLQQ